MTGQGIQSLFHCLHVKIVAEIMSYPTGIIILFFVIFIVLYRCNICSSSTKTKSVEKTGRD